jgi:methionyl aminopeptidase
MVNMGRSDVRVLSDNWTVVTKDGLPSVHVEHTLALTKSGVQILTEDPEPVPAPVESAAPAAAPSA